MVISENNLGRMISSDHPDFMNGVPDILYKYRDWGVENNRNSLKKQELFFSSFDLFNDPFEGKILYSYNKDDLTEENIRKKIQQQLFIQSPHIKGKQLEKLVKHWLKESPIRDEKYRLQVAREFQRDLNNRIGIVCLSMIRDSFPMWAYYANCHKGFCIGYDKKSLAIATESILAPVQYVEKMPTMNLLHTSNNLFKLSFSKAEGWKHEQEFRLAKFNFCNKIVWLPKDAIVEVILGLRISDTHRNEIIDEVKQRLPNIRLFQAKLPEGVFTMEFDQINF